MRKPAMLWLVATMLIEYGQRTFLVRNYGICLVMKVHFFHKKLENDFNLLSIIYSKLFEAAFSQECGAFAIETFSFM